jgi:hypothetical protein
VAGGAARGSVARGVVLGIRLCFNHHHAPVHAAVLLEFDQQATNEIGRRPARRGGDGLASLELPETSPAFPLALGNQG